jgi:hypothetical protein
MDATRPEHVASATRRARSVRLIALAVVLALVVAPGCAAGAWTYDVLLGERNVFVRGFEFVGTAIGAIISIPVVLYYLTTQALFEDEEIDATRDVVMPVTALTNGGKMVVGSIPNLVISIFR